LESDSWFFGEVEKAPEEERRMVVIGAKRLSTGRWRLGYEVV
jgi:hypothetical protein